MDSLTSFALMAFAISGVADTGAGTDSSASKSGLLYFTTPGCTYCQVVAPSVSELQRAGYPVIKIDGSQRPEVARNYGISGYPTFVLVVNGREVERAVGAQSKTELERMASVALKATQASPTIAVASNPSVGSVTPSQSRVRPATTSEIIAQGVNGLERPVLGSSALFPGKKGAEPVASSAPVETEKERGWNLFGRKEEPKTAENSPVYRGNNEYAEQADTAMERSTASYAAVRIRVRDQKGENFGSGTIIDSRYGRAVILSCGHVLRGLGANGKVEVDVFANGQPKTYVAQVIDFDLDADVGLLSIPAEQQLPVALVSGSPTLIAVGNDVCSIGCSAGSTPTKEAHQITAINKYNGPDNIECSGVPVQGRSGGGLFDRHQQIVGVCIAADPKDQRGLYCGLKPVHDILKKNRLGYLLGESGGSNTPESSIAFGEAINQPAPAAPLAGGSPFEMSMASAAGMNSVGEQGMMGTGSHAVNPPSTPASSWNSLGSQDSPASMPMAMSGQSAPIPTTTNVAVPSSWTPTTNEVSAENTALHEAKVGSKLTIIIESPNGGQPHVVVIPKVTASFLAELQGHPTPGDLTGSGLHMTSARKENLPESTMPSSQVSPMAGFSSPSINVQKPAAPAQEWPEWTQPDARSRLPQTSGTNPSAPMSEMQKIARPQQTGFYVRPFVRTAR